MKYFWGLDLIRFLSAVMVVLFHFAAFGGEAPIWPAEASEAPLNWLTPVSWMGWIGVQIFFVLSGFVIAASARSSTSSSFLIKRAIRLLPALWISATLALTARLLWGEPPLELLSAYIRTLVLLPKGPYIDGVVWTLVVEAAFYLSIVAVIAISSRFGGIENALKKYAYTLGAASAAFTLVYWASENYSHLLGVHGVSGNMKSFLFDITLLRQGVFFALGMLLYHVVKNGMTPFHRKIILLLAVICALQIDNTVGPDRSPIAPIVIWAVAATLIYYGSLYGDRLIKGNVRPIMRPIGLMTYPLYLNHFVLGQALLPIFAWWISNSAILFFVLFVVLLTNAWLMAQFPEKWIQRFLKQRLLKKSQVTVTSDEKIMA